MKQQQTDDRKACRIAFPLRRCCIESAVLFVMACPLVSYYDIINHHGSFSLRYTEIFAISVFGWLVLILFLFAYHGVENGFANRESHITTRWIKKIIDAKRYEDYKKLHSVKFYLYLRPLNASARKHPARMDALNRWAVKYFWWLLILHPSGWGALSQNSDGMPAIFDPPEHALSAAAFHQIALVKIGEYADSGHLDHFTARATTITTADSEWFEKFKSLAHGARAIFMVPGHSAGSRKELDFLLCVPDLRRKLFLIMPKRQGFFWGRRKSAQLLADDWAATRSELSSIGLRLPAYDIKGAVLVVEPSGDVRVVATYTTFFRSILRKLISDETSTERTVTSS